MDELHAQNFRYARRFFLTGMVLLALVLATPLTRDPSGHFFFTVARASSWRQLGDWVATWCSFKVILLGLSGFLMVVSAIEALIAIQRNRLAQVFGLLIIFPVFTFFLGCYYLVKAVL